MCLHLGDLHNSQLSKTVFSKWSIHDVTKSSIGKRYIQNARPIDFNASGLRKVHWYGFIFHIATNI